MRFSEGFIGELGKRIEGLESVSSMELVVVVAPESGSYKELDHQNGFILALLFLIFAMKTSIHFSGDLIPVWLIAAYWLGMFASSKWLPIHRWLSSQSRRRSQVARAARSAFIERRVLATRDRTGVLLYLSTCERLGKFVVDVGVEGKIPMATLNTMEQQWSQAADLAAFEQAVLASLSELCEPFGRLLPRAEDDENELSNEIVFQGGES